MRKGVFLLKFTHIKCLFILPLLTFTIHTYIPNIVSCVFCFFLTVLKRGKTKKGKNDLISAEEGEDPFADIASVGTSYMCCVC